MFKGLSDMAGMLKQAQEIKGKMADAQAALGKLRVQSDAGAGMVTVEANGLQQILACKVDPALLQSGDREMLEDLLVSAVNQALKKSKKAAADETSKVFGGIAIPGITDALSKLGLGG